MYHNSYSNNKYLFLQKYELQEGDVIKLGRVRLRIKCFAGDKKTDKK